MILDPINAITSINFYKKVSAQRLGRTFGYLAYLGLLFSLVFTVMLRTRLWPLLEGAFHWMETDVPTITYANGRLSTPTNERLILRYPALPQIAVALDTARITPVTAQEMADAKVLAYATSNALHVMKGAGRIEAYDLSKGPGKPFVLDAKFYQDLARGISMTLYPAGFVACFVVFCLWKALAAIFYSLIALISNGASESGWEYKPLFNISAYAQTFLVVVQAILLLVPSRIPFFPIIAVVATGTYIWLAIRKNTISKVPAA